MEKLKDDNEGENSDEDDEHSEESSLSEDEKQYYLTKIMNLSLLIGFEE